MAHLSIVSPVYLAENIVPVLVERIIYAITEITDDYEIILVDDGSQDGSWDIIENIALTNKQVKGIKLSRNFGQHNAITSGLAHSTGEWTVVMDCDLQDLPEEIINLYKKAQEGYDSVFAQRVHRNDHLLKRICSKAFYSLFSYLTETRQDPTVANFGIYKRCVVNAILSMKDQIRYFPTMVQWVGFRKYYLPVKHSSRFDGETSYNFNKLIKLAVESIIAFSDKPLRMTIKVGFLITSTSLILGVIYFVLYLSGHIKVLGFTSIILSIWLLSGIIIAIIGVLGLYIGKVFEKVKDRPTYIISEKFNL